MKRHDPTNLIGKMVLFFAVRGTNYGFRAGRVTAVDVTNRHGLRGVTLRLANHCAYRGVKMRVSVYELTMKNHPTGIIWRGKLVRLADWLNEGVVRQTTIDRECRRIQAAIAVIAAKKKRKTAAL